MGTSLEDSIIVAQKPVIPPAPSYHPAALATMPI